MAAPELIHRLVEQYSRNRDEYRKFFYNEASLRRDFLEPFFGPDGLGWDVYNAEGASESYREVLHEQSIQVDDDPWRKTPDMTFRIGPKSMFHVEAKSPHFAISESAQFSYQVRNYAWNTKCPLSILTNFEEFIVYNCRYKPARTDKPRLGQVAGMTFKYTDYIGKWDLIAGVFSKKSVLQGSFDKFAEKIRDKRGEIEVDEDFLKEIEFWRRELAETLRDHNSRFRERGGEKDLNFAVGRIIDRVVFLRVAEDRGLEERGRLKSTIRLRNKYSRLVKLFEDCDERYNSGLFQFEKDNGRAEDPDLITRKLTIPDLDIATLIPRLYEPASPYRFDKIPVHIIGQVYEQYLGHVIVLDDGLFVDVKPKPEVQKAGGVYYTPAYIVDYIIQRTVGSFLKGKSVKGAAKLKLLDPACGSGSFLLGAYEFLLQWYHRQYDDMRRLGAKGLPLYQVGENDWKLTLAERKRILLQHIHGVDIDSRAVEVAKLSLLLKVLEGENRETIQGELRLRHPLLPPLGNNIKCGNSLIGPDIWEHVDAETLTKAERDRLNPFDWKDEFRDVLANGGFDIIVGNPPWFMAGYYESKGIDYLKKHFEYATGKFDIYYLFVEQSRILLSSGGLFGMIVPNKFFHTRAATHMRESLLEKGSLKAIVDFEDQQLFAGATNYSCLLFLSMETSNQLEYATSDLYLNLRGRLLVDPSSLCGEPWHFQPESREQIFMKMRRNSVPLQSLVRRFGTGIQTGADRVLILDKEAVGKTIDALTSKAILKGRDVRRYKFPNPASVVVFPYTEGREEYRIMPDEAIKTFGRTWKYLLSHKEHLAKRIWFGKSASELTGKWYGLMYADAPTSFSSSHILTPSLSDRSNFALGQQQLFVTGTAGVTSVIPREDITIDIRYMLGMLNSRLLSFYVTNHSPIFSGKFYKFSAPYLKSLPIRTINFSDKKDKAHHDKMVKLVERMLTLNGELTETSHPDERTRLERAIKATDKQIDGLVYELYELTEEEIAIVKGGADSDTQARQVG